MPIEAWYILIIFSITLLTLVASTIISVRFLHRKAPAWKLEFCVAFSTIAPMMITSLCLLASGESGSIQELEVENSNFAYVCWSMQFFLGATLLVQVAFVIRTLVRLVIRLIPPGPPPSTF